MKQKWLLALALPIAFLLTTGESCNDCKLDTSELTAIQEQVTSVQKSKQVTLTHSTSRGTTGIKIPTDCKCMYTGDDLEKTSKEAFSKASANDPLMLTPLEGTDFVPSLNPTAKTYDRLGIYMGCPSCSGVNGGGKLPPPPPPPTGDEMLEFGKMTAAIIGPDPRIATKSSYTEVNLLNSSDLGGKTFSDLAPQDAFKGTVGNRDFFSTSRNGYTVAVIDLGASGMMRIGSFDSERVEIALNQFSAQ